MTIQKFFYTLSWAFLFVFLVPTGLILASWNAVPGDQLYDTKVGLERALLFFASPSYAAQGSLQIEYTKRRVKEVQKVATTSYARQGLSNLNTQVNDATQTIQKVNNQTRKAELAKSYVKTLRETQQVLEQQKQQVRLAASNGTYGFRAPTQTGAVSQPTVTYQPPTTVTQPTQTQPVVTQPTTNQPTTPPTGTQPSSPPSSQPIAEPILVPTPSPLSSALSSPTPDVPTPEPTAEEIEEEIEDTQEEIEETIQELERLAEMSSQIQQVEEQRGNNRNDKKLDQKKDSDRDRDDKRDNYINPNRDFNSNDSSTEE